MGKVLVVYCSMSGNTKAAAEAVAAGAMDAGAEVVLKTGFDAGPDYLVACQERGILQVLIIHGKGIGNLRRTVHAILAKHPAVVSFTLDHPQFGGWGATIVQLRPAEHGG